MIDGYTKLKSIFTVRRQRRCVQVVWATSNDVLSSLSLSVFYFRVSGRDKWRCLAMLALWPFLSRGRRCRVSAPAQNSSGFFAVAVAGRFHSLRTDRRFGGCAWRTSCRRHQPFLGSRLVRVGDPRRRPQCSAAARPQRRPRPDALLLVGDSYGAVLYGPRTPLASLRRWVPFSKFQPRIPSVRPIRKRSVSLGHRQARSLLVMEIVKQKQARKNFCNWCSYLCYLWNAIPSRIPLRYRSIHFHFRSTRIKVHSIKNLAFIHPN